MEIRGLKNEDKQEILKELALYQQNEGKSRRDYIYDKLYKFLRIDLTIFPILNAIFFTFTGIENFNFYFIIFAFLSFFIAVFYKFLISLNLFSVKTPIDALDDLEEEEWITELIHHHHDKAIELDIMNEKLIIKVNNAIFFTMNSIIISLFNIFETYLKIFLLLPIFQKIISITLIIFNFIIFFSAIFYKYLMKSKILKKFLTKILRKKTK